MSTIQLKLMSMKREIQHLINNQVAVVDALRERELRLILEALAPHERSLNQSFRPNFCHSSDKYA